MQYVKIDLLGSETAQGISNDQKAQFFKLYTQLSRKAKKFVGRKKDSKEIQEKWKILLDVMSDLVKY
jgi:hypothetical protein